MRLRKRGGITRIKRGTTRQRKDVAARGEEEDEVRVCGDGGDVIPHFLQHLLTRGGVLVHHDEMRVVAVKLRRNGHQRQRRSVRRSLTTRLPVRRGGENLVLRGRRVQSGRNVVVTVAHRVALVRRGQHGVTQRETRRVASSGESSFVQHRGVYGGGLLEGGGEERVEVVERLVGLMHGGGELGCGGLDAEESVEGGVQRRVRGLEEGARD